MNNTIVTPKLVTYLFSKANISKTPLSGVFEISPLCNMDCKMCYVKKTKGELERCGLKEKTVDDWISLAEQAKELGTLFLLLTGGEPFLKKDFKELYIKLYKMGFLLSINTNATLINEEVVEWLSRYPPRRVNVTMYGASDETYERLCNNTEGYTQTISGIKLLRDAGINVKINTSITNYNSEDLEAIHEFGKKNNLIVQATSYMYPPIRRNEKSIGINDRLTAKYAAINQVKINELRTSSKEGYIKKLKNFNKIILEDKQKQEYKNNEEGEKVKCRAGISTYWISWDGRMMACGMMNKPESYPFRDGFKEAWKEIVLSVEKIRLPKECSICKNKSICKVCAATCYTETGYMDRVPKYMCDFVEGILQESEKIYKQLIK